MCCNNSALNLINTGSSNLVEETRREIAICAIGHRTLYQKISTEEPGVLIEGVGNMVNVVGRMSTEECLKENTGSK